MRVRLATAVVAALLSSFARAAGLTLNESGAVELAVRQNLALSAARVELAASRIASETAWGVLVPGLSLTTGVSRANAAAAVPSPGLPYHWTATAGLGASATLSPAALEGIQTARLSYETGRISLEQASGEITLQVRKGFYQLILLERQLAVSAAAITTAEQTLAQAQADYGNGRVQRLTVRQAELALRTARLMLERQTVQRENTLAAFKELLGIGAEATVELVGTIETAPIGTAPLDAAAAIDERSDVRGVAAEIGLQESKNRANRLAVVWPSLTVTASIAPVFPDPLNLNNPPTAGWNDRGGLSFTLQASSLLAFLPFIPQNVDLQTGEKTLEALRIRKQEITAAARMEVATLTRSLEASHAAIESLKESVSLAEESYDLTREAYGLGTADFLSLKSAEDDLLAARYEVLSEEYNYLSSLLSLEQATGLDLRGAKE